MELSQCGELEMWLLFWVCFLALASYLGATSLCVGIYEIQLEG